MGTMNLDDFVRGQGTAMEQWYSLWEPASVSNDGRTIAGWGYGFLGPAGWVLRIDTAFVCHHSREASEGSKSHSGETCESRIPGGIRRALGARRHGRPLSVRVVRALRGARAAQGTGPEPGC